MAPVLVLVLVSLSLLELLALTPVNRSSSSDVTPSGFCRGCFPSLPQYVPLCEFLHPCSQSHKYILEASTDSSTSVAGSAHQPTG